MIYPMQLLRPTVNKYCKYNKLNKSLIFNRHCNGTSPQPETIPELTDGCPDVTRHVVLKVLGQHKEGPYELQVRSLEELSDWVAMKWDTAGTGSCQLMTAANFPLTQERFTKPTSSRVPLVVHVRRLSADAEKSAVMQRELMANNDTLLAELASVKSFNDKLLRRVSELELVLSKKQTVAEHEGLPLGTFGGTRGFGGVVKLFVCLMNGTWFDPLLCQVCNLAKVSLRDASGFLRVPVLIGFVIGDLGYRGYFFQALRSIRDRPVLALMTVLAIISLVIVAVMAGHIAASRTIAAHRGDTQKLIMQEAAAIESRLLQNSTSEVMAWREETRQDLHDYFEHLLNVTEMGFAYLKTDIDNRFKELSASIPSVTNSSSTTTRSKIVHDELQRDLRFPTSRESKPRPALRTKALAGSPEDQLLKDISPCWLDLGSTDISGVRRHQRLTRHNGGLGSGLQHSSEVSVVRFRDAMVGPNALLQNLFSKMPGADLALQASWQNNKLLVHPELAFVPSQKAVAGEAAVGAAKVTQAVTQRAASHTMSLARHAQHVAAEAENLRKLVERYVLGAEVHTVPPVQLPEPPPSYSVYPYPVDSNRIEPMLNWRTPGMILPRQEHYGVDHEHFRLAVTLH
ncbi:hypothetical protein FOL47_000686 [Perkinsus chesapeaki]|uniref:Uncharacterized protein n=1 Tax=Perkinsus chesapeaki TaxID=330153 RepID=A0A7J6ML25_PERCH|nr:hypothetical protein FOL47_000686 [Perkinsus chesapeaki]